MKWKWKWKRSNDFSISISFTLTQSGIQTQPYADQITKSSEASKRNQEATPKPDTTTCVLILTLERREKDPQQMSSFFQYLVITAPIRPADACMIAANII